MGQEELPMRANQTMHAGMEPRMSTGGKIWIQVEGNRLAALALAFALVGGVTSTANAADLNKDAFKTGCESGGGSYLESADGSFQCNMKSGGTVKCQDTHSQCTYTSSITRRNMMAGLAAGRLEVMVPVSRKPVGPRPIDPKPVE